jgi:hypothetical protein
MEGPFTACQHCRVGTIRYTDDGTNMVVIVQTVSGNAIQKVDLHVSGCADIPGNNGNFNFPCKEGTFAQAHCKSNKAMGGTVTANCQPGVAPCIIVIPFADILAKTGLTGKTVNSFALALHADVAGTEIQRCCGSPATTTWGGWWGGPLATTCPNNRGCVAPGFEAFDPANRKNWAAWAIYTKRCASTTSIQCGTAKVATLMAVQHSDEL